jgi:hypothetical protein
MHDCEMHACEMHACEMHACKIHANEMYAHEMYACEIYAYEITYMQLYLPRDIPSPKLLRAEIASRNCSPEAFPTTTKPQPIRDYSTHIWNCQPRL